MSILKTIAFTFQYILLLLSNVLLFGQKSMPDVKEYQVKAVFLYNFTQFVEWPATTFETANSPIVIGVLGKDPFGSFLDETIQEENVNGHPLRVTRFSKVEDVKDCHILFISDSEQDHLKKILEKFRSQPILTVSDMNNFARQGGIIRFVTEERKTRLRINIEAARLANLTISSKLLRLAEIVPEEKKTD
jgi:hypothetical protein